MQIRQLHSTGILLVVLYFLISACTQDKGKNFYMPAEFEPHEAVWMGWHGRDTMAYPVACAMLKGLLPHVPVRIAADSDSLLKRCKEVLVREGIDTGLIQFYVMKGERFWIRDHGASFLVDGNGNLAVADFNWSHYGIKSFYEAFYEGNRDSVNKYLARSLKSGTGRVDSLMGVSQQAKIIPVSLVMEGGAIEVNGKGTLILGESVTFQRNPGLSKEQIEGIFRENLGVTHIIWLKQGLVEDEHMYKIHPGNYLTLGTGGHTDEYVRFADASTILLAWIDEKEKDLHPFNKINYERMQANLRILEAARDQDGKPFRIIKMPLPGPFEKIVSVKKSWDEAGPYDVAASAFPKTIAPVVGDTLKRIAASSYLNYFVSNGVVLVPSYRNSPADIEKEERVKRIFNEIFPGRELVWINSMQLNWNGGGIHCSTQQQPLRSKN